jgi:hypothetical protein
MNNYRLIYVRLLINRTIYSNFMIKYYRRRGMSAAAIEATLLAENTTRCDPFLSELGRLAEAMKSMRPTLTLQTGGASRGR